MAVTAGTVLGGKYRLVAELGSGGMGTVWQARDEALARDVAVKTLRVPFSPTAAEYREAVSRFQREARAAGALDSAHVIPVHDLGTSQGDDGIPVPYLVMQLVRGRSLADRLREESPLPVGTAVRIALHVCEALEAAHAAGVVHRDVKPSNVMLTDAGDTKVVDFGIAKFLADVTGNDVTATGGPALGTLLYMAPERFQQEDDVVPASDLYALGCVLHEMITGSPPFTATDAAALLQQHLTGVPVPVRSVRPGVPAQLEELVSSLLDKSPEARPTATAAKEVLRSIGPDKQQAVPDPGSATVVPWVSTGLSRARAILAGPRGTLAAFTSGVVLAGVVAALAAVVVPGGGGSGDGHEDTAPGDAERVVAVVGDFKGDGKAMARTALNSVRMALERAHGNKALAFRLTAVAFDDDGTADGAQQVAKRVVKDRRVVAVVAPVGDPGGDVMAQASRTYARHGLVVLSPWTRLTGDLGATTYQVAGASGTPEKATTDLLNRLHDGGGLTGVRFLSHGGREDERAVNQIFAGVDLGISARTERIEDDIPQIVRDIRKSDENVVYYGGDSATFEKLDAALAGADFSGLLITTDTSLAAKYRTKAPWLVTRDYCDWNDSFDPAYEDKFDEKAEFGGVESYDATQALVAALDRAPRQASVETLRERIARNVGEVSPHGLCYPDLRFGRDGHLLAPRTFVDEYEPGEVHGSELGVTTDDDVLARARDLMR